MPTTQLRPVAGERVTVVLMLVDRTPVAREIGTVVSTNYDDVSAPTGFTLRLLSPEAMQARSNPRTPRPIQTAFPPEVRRASNEFDNPLQGLETNMLTLFIDFSLSEQAADSITLDEIPSLSDESLQNVPAAEAPQPEVSPDDSWQEPQFYGAAPKTDAAGPLSDAAVPLLQGPAAVPMPRRRRRVAVSAVVAGTLCGAAIAVGVARFSSEPDPVAKLSPPPPAAPVRAVRREDAGRGLDAFAMVDAGRDVRAVVAVKPDVRAVAPVPIPAPPAAPRAAPAAVSADLGCQVRVSSRPAGADIVLGDQIKGQTPATVDLPCGPVALIVKRPRYQDAPVTFELRAGTPLVQDVVLQRPLVELTVTSDPAGAEVVTRGRVRGVTPVTLTVPRFEGVDIEVKYPGRPAWKKQLRLTTPTATLHAPLK